MSYRAASVLRQVARIFRCAKRHAIRCASQKALELYSLRYELAPVPLGRGRLAVGFLGHIIRHLLQTCD